jgi:hypothetical protein
MEAILEYVRLLYRLYPGQTEKHGKTLVSVASSRPGLEVDPMHFMNLFKLMYLVIIRSVGPHLFMKENPFSIIRNYTG